LGAKSIRNNRGEVLVTGDIAATQIVDLIYDGTVFMIIGGLGKSTLFPRTFLSGFTMSRDTDTSHDTNVTAGDCIDSGNDTNIILGTEMTKRIDSAWTAGNDNGGFPSAGGSGLTLSNNTWYHVFVIYDVTNGLTDVGYDTNLNASVLTNADNASAYTKYRRVGAVRTDGSANILGYSQLGDYFYWDVIVDAFNGGPPSSATDITLRTPLGLKTLAIIRGTGKLALNVQRNYSIWSPDQTNRIATVGGALPCGSRDALGDTARVANEMTIKTNTSSQVTHIVDVTGSYTVVISTEGYIDLRGKE